MTAPAGGSRNAARLGYAELRRTVSAAGLLGRAYRYYAALGVGCVVLLAISVLLLFTSPRFPGQLQLAALLSTLAVVEAALLGHDAGHRAIFRRSSLNHCAGQFGWTLMAGVGFWYWNDRHNRHHGCTNDLDADPEMRPGLLDGLPGHSRLTIALLSIVLSFVTFRIEGGLYTLRALSGGRRLTEAALLSVNLLFWGLVLIHLKWGGLGVLVANQVLSSVYLAAIVAPNHRAMPLCTKATRRPFVEQQVVSSRNLSSNVFWDLLYGGLNSQIEHHLFPTMPRPHLARARATVRVFCDATGLPYAEVSPLCAYREVVVDAMAQWP